MKLLTFRPARARTGHFGVLLADNRVLDITALSGRQTPVAAALSPQERGEFARALEAAIWEARRSRSSQ